MKTLVLVGLALVAANVGRAEIFRPRAAHGGFRSSGESHARHGHRHDRHHGLVGDSHHHRWYPHFHHGHSPFRHADWHVSLGYGWSPYRSFYHPYRVFPEYRHSDGYGCGYPYYSTYGYGSGSAAAGGLLLGALAGAVIGNNSGELHHSAWRGSAWGAGLGWLLGSVVDARRRAEHARAPVVVPPAPVVQAQPQPVAPPQQVTIINNYYTAGTPMSSVNGMFGR